MPLPASNSILHEVQTVGSLLLLTRQHKTMI